MFTLEETKEIIKQAFHKGLEYFQEGNFHHAELLYRQILKIDPEDDRAIQMLGLIAHRTGSHEEALDLLQKSLQFSPEQWETYTNLASIYTALGKYDEAIKCLNKIKNKKPDSVHIHNNLGLAYQAKREFGKAEKCIKKAIKIAPNESHLYFNLGNIYADQLQFDKAIRNFKKSIKLNKDFTAGHWNLASSLLLSGNWKEGWKEYEYRWMQFEAFKKGREKFQNHKEWTGQKLDNKKILLYTEQGIGDTFQFVRYAKVLKEKGAYIILECPNPKKFGDITKLMSNQDYIDEIYISKDEQPKFDYHQALTTLPYIFETTPNNVPCSQTYIQADSSSLISEDQWYKYKLNFKIGICWGGSPIHQRDEDRSCYLKQFKILQNDNIKLFSLQKDLRKRVWHGNKEINLTENTEDMSVVDMSPFMVDFNETANIIKRMDLVISVDTAVAHLAAAMGKKTWLLLSYVPDWRWGWLEEETKTPWYKEMKLYRQPNWDDWDSVFEKIANDITF